MTLNSSDFRKAVAVVMEHPQKLPNYNMVHFGQNKLKRATLTGYFETTLEGAEEAIFDGEFLKRVDPPTDSLEIVKEVSQWVFRSGGMLLKRNEVLEPIPAFPEPIGRAQKIIVPENSVKCCLAAASSDRPSLSGLVLDGDGETLLLAGTNGQQLHAIWAGKTKLKDRLLIETSLAKLIQQDFILTVHDNLVVAENSLSRFLFPRIAEKIPDIRAYVKKEFNEFCEVHTHLVLQNAKRLRTLYPDSYLVLDFQPEELSISVFGAKDGEAQCSMPCKSTISHQVKIKDCHLLDSLSFAGDKINFSQLKSAPGLAIKNENTVIMLYGARIE